MIADIQIAIYDVKLPITLPLNSGGDIDLYTDNKVLVITEQKSENSYRSRVFVRDYKTKEEDAHSLIKIRSEFVEKNPDIFEKLI